MKPEYRLCPVCREHGVNLAGEDDEVEYTCSVTGKGFVAGEARRGHLFKEKEAEQRRISELENRVSRIEAWIKKSEELQRQLWRD